VSRAEEGILAYDGAPILDGESRGIDLVALRMRLQRAVSDDDLSSLATELIRLPRNTS